MVEVFKTNIQKREQSRLLLAALSEIFPSSKINVDLSDRDKVLRVEGENMEASHIMIIVEKHGFTCEVLE